MSRSVSITKEFVDGILLELVRTEGLEALTARNIADKAGCSTQPIYKIYENLDDVKENAIRLVCEYTKCMIFHYDKTAIPFLNTGLGFIHIAATERILFRTFVVENELRQTVFSPLNNKRLYGLMEDLQGESPLNREEREQLFFDTMIYTNGLAHLAYSGQLTMNEKQVAECLAAFFFRLSGLKWEGEIYKETQN